MGDTQLRPPAALAVARLVFAICTRCCRDGDSLATSPATQQPDLAGLDRGAGAVGVDGIALAWIVARQFDHVDLMGHLPVIRNLAACMPRKIGFPAVLN